MIRGVADVNALVSAAVNPHGVCAQLWRAAISERWQLVASPHLLAELDEVLHRQKFRKWVTLEDADSYIKDIGWHAEVIPDALRPWPTVTRDPKDDYIVALARAAGVNVIVSGDVHLTELVDLVPPVVTPATLLGMVQSA